MTGAGMSEEELARITVGELIRHDAPVVLAPPDPTWPRVYETVAHRIRRALGDDALRIEHVGSTSVPNLPAKPIIDVLLVVPSSADEAAYVPALESSGFVLRIREPSWYEHRCLKGRAPDVNLHVFSPGAAEIERVLLFRNHLRIYEAERSRYAAVKAELAARTWTYVQDYADAKSAVVEGIIERARAAGTSAA